MRGRQQQRVAGAHVRRHELSGDSLGDYEVDVRSMEAIDRFSRKREALFGDIRIAAEQDQAPSRRQSQPLPRRISRAGLEQGEVEAARDHVVCARSRKVVSQGRRHDDDPIGNACDDATRCAQHPSRPEIATLSADDSLQIAAAKRDDQRETLGKREEAALAELSVHEMVFGGAHPPLNFDPGANVTARILCSAERDNVHVYPRAPMKTPDPGCSALGHSLLIISTRRPWPEASALIQEQGGAMTGQGVAPFEG